MIAKRTSERTCLRQKCMGSACLVGIHQYQCFIYARGHTVSGNDACLGACLTEYNPLHSQLIRQFLGGLLSVNKNAFEILSVVSYSPLPKVPGRKFVYHTLLTRHIGGPL